MENETKNVLAEKLRRIDDVFSSALGKPAQASSEVTARYYNLNSLAYRLFHSSADFLHMGIASGSRFEAQDMLFQAGKVHRLIGGRAGLRVLELGMGKGANSAWLAAQNPKCDFVGLDLSETHLRIAAMKAKRLANMRVNFGDFDREIQEPNGSFDIVFFVESLCHAADKQRVIRRVRQLLKDDGLLVVFDGFRTESSKTMDSETNRAMQMVERGMAVGQFEYEESFENSLESQGFQVLENVDYSTGIMPSLIRIERLAFRFFKRPIIAKLISRILPLTFTLNSVSGYLMPTLVSERAFSYRMFVAKSR